ncbi:unnamed protein product [Rotaria magnacalcarata]|uniref:Uncharacterized protein n=1 Tax=Rotaria magnacalcarata TaxID=392030 RepID=A0A816KRE0_9BILA|nr:unnamed protein product [Rotaria magnacalcarata]CAF1519190.1 unnamed protein product [Rotaria magnacalcarata]CAF1923119.1 unnamed protein product [Rotaria magnacalcarata]CAF2035811.1 unnamed protein product [Rotaria magnacalcarata]CAF2119118.1 unnamed protein product [Rotaria magnacalcarata]
MTNRMNTCSFTFTSLRTQLPCDVLGVERTWEYLKREFDRYSDGLPDAKYYETMGSGPQLFAVVGDTVYYHDEEKWFPYTSATNIVHDTINLDDELK